MSGSGPRARAQQRLAILARQLERVGLADAQVITDADAPGREVLRHRAKTVVTAAGLAGLLADAQGRFRDWIQGAYNRVRSDLEVIQYRLGSTLGPVEDRVDVFRAVDDAVLATVGYELIPEDDRVELLEPYDRLLALRPERATSPDA